jgi:DNA mismatch repair protein MutL
VLCVCQRLVYRHPVARIRRLPDAVVNQIAAGEVVERPASVVKELVENAIDAGARTITVRLGEGGCRLVDVADDGCGMDAEDAVLALERHATSKLAADSDLAAVATLGFRGEALPSIAAAAHVVLKTAVADGEGTLVEVNFGVLAEVRPCGRPRGTRIVVRDLFERLPARRKFLRTPATELRHASTILTALAFTHPEIGFALEHGGRSLVHLPPVADLAQRLPDLVGAQRARSASFASQTAGSLTVEVVLLPARHTAQLHLAVNGRIVRDRLMVATSNRALRGPSGRLVADAFVSLALPVAEVDVNVHPTKAEVRFSEPGRVAAALTAALAKARTASLGPVEVRRIVSVSPAAHGSRPSLPLGHPLPPAPRARAAPVVREAVASPAERAGGPTLTPWGRYIGQYRDTYLVVEDGDGMLLVDQHNAHERVLYEELMGRREAPASQPLLLAEVVELTPALAALAAEVGEELRGSGLELETMSGAAVRVLATPSCLPVADAAHYVRQLLEDLEGGAAPGESLRERTAASLACHAAIKKNHPLSRVEAEHLIARLAAAEDPHRCPHGRPIVLRLEQAEIERRIGRR